MAAVFSGALAAASVTFVKLTGLAGGSPAETAIYRADLSAAGLADILSISIEDNSGGLGGSPGQFTGFDLDAIVLSTTNCATAACAASLTGLAVFDFSTGTSFSPGVQRVPVDLKLFGAGPTGNTLDNAVATLGSFDADSSTLTPAGLLSMGDGGAISFNLTSAVAASGLYLYIGEVGDNGEVAAGSVTVSADPVETAPEPVSMLLTGAGLIGLSRIRRSVR
jgi:hypothetical protein